MKVFAVKSDLSLFNVSPRKLAAKLMSSKQGIRRLLSAFLLPAQDKRLQILRVGGPQENRLTWLVKGLIDYK